MIIFIKLVIIMITLFLNITLLMWKQFILFEFHMILPLLLMRRNLLMWRVIKILCLWIMKRMLYVIAILMNPFMMLLKITMKEEHMIHDASVMFQFFAFMRASLKSS